jgi:putative MATE family efflux protein
MVTESAYRLPESYSFKSIWRITFPILVALVMEELLGMTDTAFLGRVGEIELGASAIAGVYFTILYMLGFGFSIGVQIIIGRRNGEASESGTGFSAIGRVFWQGVWFLTGLSLLTMLLSYYLSPPLLRGLMRSENIYEASVVYVNWRIPGLFFAFMTALFRAFYVGICETKSLTWNSIVLVASNVFLDWVLIFGHLGAPALGIQGAALASTIAEGVSFLFFVVWAFFTADRKYGLQKMVKPVWEELKHVFSTASWVMLEYVLNISVWLLFFLFIEHLGEEQLAIANIVRSISEVPFVFSAAFASTAATLVSNIIGEGHPEGVIPVIRRVLMLCVVTMVPVLALFALFPHQIIGLFTDIPSLIQGSVPTLWVMCAAMLLTLPWNVYLQSVAGTGDTRVCLRFDAVALSIYAVYCTVIISILHSDIALCWTADGVYSLCIWIQCIVYIHGKKWQKKTILR